MKGSTVIKITDYYITKKQKSKNIQLIFPDEFELLRNNTKLCKELDIMLNPMITETNTFQNEMEVKRAHLMSFMKELTGKIFIKIAKSYVMLLIVLT